MTTSRAPSPRPDRLHLTILATATILGVTLGIFALMGPPAGALELPAFIVMAHGFIVLATFCVSYLALGRYRALGDAAAYWIGVAFGGYSISTLFYLLQWPGLRLDGRPVLGQNPGGAGWTFVLSQAVMGLLLIVAGSACHPKRRALRGATWGWSLAGWTVLFGLLNLLLISEVDRLPAFVSGVHFTPVGVGVAVAVALLMAAGATLSAFTYRRCGDPLVGYVALTQILFAFADATAVSGGQRYDVLWYLARLGLVAGCLVALFGLLWEYVGLYRRERAAARSAQRQAARLGQLSAEVQAANEDLAAANERLRATNEELRRAHDAVRESEQLYRTVGNLVPFGMWITDEQNENLYISPPLLEMLGMTREQIQEGGWPAALHPDDRQRVIAYAEATIAAREEYQDEYRLRGHDGRYHWLLSKGVPRFDPAGEFEGYVGMNIDITSRREQEDYIAALADTAQHRALELDTVIDSIADGVMVFGSDGSLVRVNAALRAITRYAPVPGAPGPVKQLAALDMRDGEDRPIPIEQSPGARALRGETLTGVGIRVRADVDRTVETMVSAAPLRRADGTVTGAVVTVTDITDLREAHKQLQRHRYHLEELVAERTADLEVNQQRLRGLAAELVTAEQNERQRLATIIHDDIAQTLGAMKLHLGALRRQHPEAGAAIETIAAMVQQVTQQARGIMTELNPPVLHSLGLAEAVRWWGNVAQERHGIAVRVDAAPDQPTVTNVVQVTVFQAVKELIQNAAKHAGVDEVEVRLQGAGQLLEVIVTDGGVGFDPAGVQTTADKGFGLFNIRERMVALGGECRITSAPGHGTQIVLRVPVGQCEAAADSHATHASSP